MTKKNKNIWVKVSIWGSLLSFIAPVLMTILGGAGVVAAPVIAAAFAWNSVAGWFGDADWKNAVQQIASYKLESDRDNLLLYKPLYIDGKAVPEEHEAHWANYGKLNTTVYRVPTGKHTYTFDVGREALISEVVLLLACRDCNSSLNYVSDEPEEPGKPPGSRLDGAGVASYLADPARFPKGLENTAKGAKAGNVLPPDGKPITARYLTLFIHNKSPDAFLAQLIAYPPGQRSNTLWSSQEASFDSAYRAVYGAKIEQALSGNAKTNFRASGGLGISKVASEDGTNYFHEWVDHKLTGPGGGGGTGSGSATTTTPPLPPVIYPLVNNPPRAPDVSSSGSSGGSSSSSNSGSPNYRHIYLSWKLHPATKGRGSEVGISWLTPSARKWQAYLLDSGVDEDKAVLEALFGNRGTVGGAGLSQNPVSQSRLVGAFDTPNGSNNGGTTRQVIELPPGDKRDTLVIVFEEQGVVQPGQGQNIPSATLPGLPPAWLAPVEIFLYEKKPPAPTKWPRSGAGSFVGVRGGSFDIRSGSVSAERIEEIIAKKPWRGITPGGYSAGQAPQPNKLVGLGGFFVEMGQKYGLNPAYAIAFAMKETELGTTGYHVYNANTGQFGYNLYGMSNHSAEGIWSPTSYCKEGYSGRFCGYASWQESIEEFFILLKAYTEGAILKRDGTDTNQKACPCVTIDQILWWYAPAFENDTALYIQQVKDWITSWGAAGPPPTGGPGPGGGGGGGGVGSVPTISQYDCSQYAGSDYGCGVWSPSTCGPTSATMLINWAGGHNLRVADTLVFAAYNGVTPAGTSGWGYLDAMQSRFGFQWRRVSYSSTDDYLNGLKEFTSQGQPVIANVVGAPFYYGHFFVVVGYELATDSFTVNDPATVTQPGNPPGVVQQWSANKLGSYLAGRLGPGFPAIIIGPSSPPVAALPPRSSAASASYLPLNLMNQPFTSLSWNKLVNRARDRSEVLRDG